MPNRMSNQNICDTCGCSFSGFEKQTTCWDCIKNQTDTILEKKSSLRLTNEYNMPVPNPIYSFVVHTTTDPKKYIESHYTENEANNAVCTLNDHNRKHGHSERFDYCRLEDVEIVGRV